MLKSLPLHVFVLNMNIWTDSLWAPCWENRIRDRKWFALENKAADPLRRRIKDNNDGRWWTDGQCGGKVTLKFHFEVTSSQVSWTRYLRIVSRDLLQVWHKCPVGRTGYNLVKGRYEFNNHNWRIHALIMRKFHSNGYKMIKWWQIQKVKAIKKDS